MTRRLPILVLLSAICFLAAFSPSFAQEPIPEVTSIPNLSTQASGNPWDNFLKNLIPFQFKQIPDTLQRVNCANLPSEACDGIESTVVQADKDKLPSDVKPQANDEGDKKKIVSYTAGLYTIASGVNTPPEISHASTNIPSMFAGIINFFGQIFNKGNKEAQNFAEVALPQNVADTNILGASDTKENTSMDTALPLRQCADLPAGLCDKDNKLHILQ